MGDVKTAEPKKDYLKELWEAFEKTGSIGAYILYADAKKRTAKNKKIKAA
ncbi:MAG: hypothetical protein ACLFP1_02040 [Candidatus Goldiibacteriota bacterium]